MRGAWRLWIVQTGGCLPPDPRGYFSREDGGGAARLDLAGEICGRALWGRC